MDLEGSTDDSENIIVQMYHLLIFAATTLDALNRTAYLISCTVLWRERSGNSPTLPDKA